MPVADMEETGIGSAGAVMDYRVRMHGVALGLLLLGCAVSIVAEEASLEALIEAGDYPAAYALAQQQAEERAGEPDFDFMYGLAAVEMGEPQRAIFALERVLALRPQDHRARLELGRAYYLMGDYPTARRLFEQVLAAQPPPRVQANIRLFLDDITQRTIIKDVQFARHVQLDFGIDSNINSATAATSVAVPALGNVSLSEGSREMSDEFWQLDVGAEYQKILSKVHGVFMSAGFNNRHNVSHDEFDLRTLDLGVGYMRRWERVSLRLPLQWQKLDVDERDYRRLTTLGAELMLMPLPRQQLAVFAQVGAIRHADQHVRDVDMALAGVGWNTGHADWPVLITLAAFAGVEEASAAAGDQFGKRYVGGRGGLQWNIAPAHRLVLDLTAQNATYNAIQPVFGVTRQDDLVQASLKWSHVPNDRIQLDATLLALQNVSNLALYQYERVQLGMGMRVNF